MKRAIVLFVWGGILLLGCNLNGNSVRLANIDSLVVAELYDSAYQILKKYDSGVIRNQRDKAHYNLLRVQLGYLMNEPIELSDSILDNVISYFVQHIDHEKLADAYYYRAIGAYKKGDSQQAIMLYKNAEYQANQSGNLRQKYKISEGISFVNGRCAKYDLQLDYAKRALELSKTLNNKKWIAYSLYRMDLAYSKLGKEDSAFYYLNQIPTYIDYIDEKERPILLSNIGFLLLDRFPQRARSYLEKSLSYHEYTATYEYLAEISYEEGNTEEAYHFWKKALAVQDATPKDNVIRNIIEYDMERGKTDSICEMVTQIIAIRDSIDSRLKDDTIKDLQTHFDHEVAMHEEIIKWQWRLFAVVLLVIVLVGYMVWRRYNANILLRTHQMEIQNHLNEIDNLKSSGEDTSKEVEALNNEIKRIMDEKSPRLNEGRILYDRIVANEKMSRWKKADEKKFIEYYTATHYKTINRIKKVPRKHELTTHQLFYLILVEMGKTDLEILIILSITKEALRTLRHRTQPLENG